jgi:hypothetical protein
MLVTLVMPQQVSAGDTKTQTFNVPADTLFMTATKVVREHYKLKDADAKKMALVFRTGTTMATWGFTVTVVIQASGDNQSILGMNVDNGGNYGWGRREGSRQNSSI